MEEDGSTFARLNVKISEDYSGPEEGLPLLSNGVIPSQYPTPSPHDLLESWG